MDLLSKLTDLRGHAFQKITEAATRGQAEEVSRLARIAKECEGAIEATHSLELATVRLEADLKDGGVHIQVRESPHRQENIETKTTNDLSPRQIGNKVRAAYAEQINHDLGLELRRKSEVIYETGTGKNVGVAYAYENEPDRWWLGLPDEEFEFIVLICKTRKDELLDFVFPPNVIKRIWGSLSRDKKRHVKFHVFRLGSGYDLRIKTGFEKIGHLIGGTRILSE